MNALINHQNQSTAQNHVDSIQIDAINIRRDQEGRYCINDLHKASGGVEKYQPNFYLRNKQTKDLINAIESSKNDHSANLQSAVKVINGGHERGTYVVKELVYAYAMWISAVFHLKIIRVFDAIVQHQVATPKQLSRMDLIQLALQAEQENIALKHSIALLEPKAQALDAIAETSHTYNIREVAKTIGIKQSQLIELLLQRHWVYRDADKKLQPIAPQYVSNGVFINRPSQIMTDKSGEKRTFLHMRITAYGLTRITGLVQRHQQQAKNQ